MQMDTEIDLTSAIEEHHLDDIHLQRQNIFRRRYSIWAFSRQSRQKRSVSLVNSSTMRRSSHNWIEKTNPKVRNQQGSQRHQSDQILPHYGSSSVICAL